MYTDDMRKAFHNIVAPKDFGVSLIDADNFINIKLSEKSFLYMTHDQKIEAIEYVSNVKKALEACGAIVLITREALK